MTSGERAAVKRCMQQLIIDGIVSPTEWPILQSKWLKEWEIWVSHIVWSCLCVAFSKFMSICITVDLSNVCRKMVGNGARQRSLRTYLSYCCILKALAVFKGSQTSSVVCG